MKFVVFLFLAGITISYSQDGELVSTINSTGDLQLLRKKIDSLIMKNEEKANSMELAEFYHDVANKFYFMTWWKHRLEEDLESAIIYSRKSLELKKTLPGLKAGSLEKTAYNLGYFSSLKGNVFDAINYFLFLIENGKEERLVQKGRTDLGNLYVLVGDFYKGLDQFDQSYSIYIKKDSLDKEDGLKIADLCLLKAGTYGQMDFVQFEQNIVSCLIRADSILEAQKITNSDFTRAFNQISGNRLLKIGQYAEAIPYFKSILRDSSTMRPSNLARVFNSLALSQIKIQNFNAATINLNWAISLDSVYASPYNNFGDLYLAENEYEKALFFYQKAIAYTINKNEKIRYDDLPDIKDLELALEKTKLLGHIVQKANAWLKYYDYDSNKEHLDHALKTFVLADKLVDIIRFESTEYQSKLFWREKGSSLYMQAIKACYLLEKPENAYYFMERNKALLLLENLSNEDAKQIAHIPAEKAQQEFNLKRAIFLAENELQNNVGFLNQDSLLLLEQTVRDHKYKYEKFIDALNTTYPEYAKFKRKIDVLPFKNLKANYIADNKATLHYILNEEDGYGLLTTADTTALFQLNTIPDLNQEVGQFMAALANGISDIGNFKTIANTVFHELIPKAIHQKIMGKQLTIIPDYTLQQIPFETLVVDSNELKYLFEEVEIGYAYSASLLAYNNRHQKKSRIDFLGVAPITFNNLKLPELYFSENEIKGIEKVYPGETLINAQASKGNFIKNAGNHNILHLATHADIGDSDNPWVAFSDSKMYLKEIYATKNQADMVVLSGCNTSNGELERGEGVMSLARGFFYSGAKSVVSTLWPVADEAGKDILIHFYKNLHKGLTKSKALQKAKFDYLATTEEEELKHPYYWGGFIVLGDNAPISDKPISSWLLIGLGILGTGILFFGYKKIKAHRAAA